MMIVVKPIAFAPSMLVSTTAPEPTPAWSSATTYAKDDEVTHPDATTGNVRIWRSLINSNTTEPSQTATTEWLDTGPCNKCAMFDTLISTQSVVATGDLVVVLQPGDVISAMGFINLVGATLTVDVEAGGEAVYSKTVDLQTVTIADWWDYYFRLDEQLNQVVLTDLPLYYAPTITITVTPYAGVAAIGHCVFGTAQEVGQLALGASSGIIDYSRKSTDEFGDTSFVRRAFADEMGGQLLVDNAQLNRIKRLLRDLRATPCLWIGVDDETYVETLVLYGWYRSHRIAISYPNQSLLDLELEGLT
jgi:hypothetical protein